MILYFITIFTTLYLNIFSLHFPIFFCKFRLKVGQITSDTTAKLFKNACAAAENSDEDFEGSNEDKRKIQIDVLKHFELMVIIHIFF
jgi:hypothetical protein